MGRNHGIANGSISLNCLSRRLLISSRFDVASGSCCCLRLFRRIPCGCGSRPGELSLWRTCPSHLIWRSGRKLFLWIDDTVCALMKCVVAVVVVSVLVAILEIFGCNQTRIRSSARDSIAPCRALFLWTLLTPEPLLLEGKLFGLNCGPD